MGRVKSIKMLKKVVILGLIIILSGVFTVMGVNFHVKNTGSKYIMGQDKIPEADAVIVLGAYVFPDGKPSVMLKDRLDTGIDIYKKGKARKLVVTGDNGQVNYDEVNAMREYAQSKGIDRKDIFMDHAGFNTYDSMYRARDIFLINKAVIVTQEYHLKRALYIARKLGIEAYGVPADKRTYAYMRYYKNREIAARFKDFVQVNILKTKPKFLGDTIPVWLDGSMTDDGKS